MELAIMAIGIVLALLSYSQRKIEVDLLNPFARLLRVLVSAPATILWASISLVGVCLAVWHSSPGRQERKAQYLERELSAMHAVGRAFAEGFSRKAPAKSKVLVVDRANKSSAANLERYHAAFMDGFRGNLFHNIVGVRDAFIQVSSADAETELAKHQASIFAAAQLDEIIAKHDDANVLILLIGLPQDYVGSRTWVKVQEGKLVVGLYSEDIYELGAMIFSNEIAICITPKERYSYEPSAAAAADAEAFFRERFHFVTAANIFDLTREYRRLFKISRK